MHIFTKTLENFLQTNAYLLKEVSTFSIGTSRINRYEVVDAFLTLTPDDEDKGYVPKLKMVPNHGFEIKFKNINFIGNGKVEGVDTKFGGKIKIIKCTFKLAPTFQRGTKINLIPDVRIDTVYVEYVDETLYFEMNGRQQKSPGIKSHIKDWVKNSIDGQFHLPRIALAETNTVMMKYLETKFDLDSFNGQMQLFKFQFFEDYFEMGKQAEFIHEIKRFHNLQSLIHVGIGFRFKFLKYISSDFIRKTGVFNDEHMPNQQGIELIIDENVVNTVFYAMYHLDKEISVRSVIKDLKDYNKMLSVKTSYNIQTTGLANVWPEIYDAYGKDKEIDFKCSFGKSLFEEFIETSSPYLRFEKPNIMNLTAGIGCSVLVNTEGKKWDHFRAVYFTLHLRSIVDFSHTPNGRKLKNNSHINKIELEDVVVVKENKINEDEAELFKGLFNSLSKFLKTLINSELIGKK